MPNTIEIPTGNGEVLPIPDSEQAREYFGEVGDDWWFDPMPRVPGVDGPVWKHDFWQFCRLTISAVAAELWLREAERMCPEGYNVECSHCVGTFRSSCPLDQDLPPNSAHSSVFGDRAECFSNAAAARAWGTKETT